MWIVSIILQILEGYWYLLLGEQNCGTQLKLSSIITGCLFLILAYKYIVSDYNITNKWLKLLGDKSFGIYVSHIAIMMVLEKVTYYKIYAIYPINGLIATGISFAFVSVGGKILRKYGKYFALETVPDIKFMTSAKFLLLS